MSWKKEENRNLFHCNFFSKNCKGQVTIFIIIAIIIVALVILFFIIRQNLTVTQIPVSIQPLYNTFLSCIEDKAKTGIDVLESQAGYIKLPEFEPGSPYMPFSSQLNFLGNPIPYWYYVSGNNIQKEQVPSKKDMEEDLGEFIGATIRECNLDNYYQQGFEIIQGEPKVSTTINKNTVDVKLSMDLEISKEEDNVFVRNHRVTIKTNLGKLYDSAKKIYDKEQKELFLEKYAIDTLRLYAPVDGVELTCSPKTWDANNIFDNLESAIETNTLALTTESPSTKEQKYFFVDAGIDETVSFVNSKSWPHSFEVAPSEGSLLLASPIGNQQGLGVLGFCYVPYHFVYNIKYPILVQVQSRGEVFQFPVAVVVQGNKPREALASTAQTIAPNLCNHKNTPVNVKVYDTNLNPVDASVSYECFGVSCEVGNASSGTLTADFPQCVNGYIIVRAEGFDETKYLFSTVEGGEANIIMDKLYGIDVQLKLDNTDYNGNAIIYFSSEDNSRVISYPDQKQINLSEGQYEISVYIYRNSSIRFGETTIQECTEIPSTGIGGLFGLKEKKCFDVKVPAQVVSNVLAGGGKQDYYILESELQNSNVLEINAHGFGIPKTIEDLQNNYLIFDSKGLGVNFR